ncbi:MAG: pesticin C-terminus-like muramidase [Treponema sp.]|nr:pesticin C-terminus-like muramidase [Treponema sp.]
MINYSYINTVLAKYEGKGYARGYIPCKGGTYYGGNDPAKGEPFGASGVTIATGVDLGQQTKAGLESMGIAAGTIALLEPYLGLKKWMAVEKLKAVPITITAEQVIEIDDAVHAFYINNTANMFGREKFEAAPKEAQAVAVSLHYQFGSLRRDASPGLGLAWEAMRSGDYKKAAQHLTNPAQWSAEHRQYFWRRKQEAGLLNAI